VIQVQEDAVAVEVACAVAVHVTMAFVQEAASAWERPAVFIPEVETRSTLAEREARESVLNVEAESTTALAFAREEAEGYARRVSFLEGELTDVCQARDTTEVSFQDLSSVVVDAHRWWEEGQRECRELV
jgi:hypothetical protein